MLSGLNAHFKDSRNKYESQERNIQEQRKEVQERLPDLNEKAAKRENESFKRYFGLKNIIEAFRQNRNRDQVGGDGTSLES